MECCAIYISYGCPCGNKTLSRVRLMPCQPVLSDINVWLWLLCGMGTQVSGHPMPVMMT